MDQRQRISTNLGKDQKVNVELKQDFGLLEILSLKLTQQDIYTSLCSDYGVVCGRITANNGYGVPNAKVSIFIPLKIEHEDDPVISALYPYKNIGDKTEDGYRYNLLPERKQHGGHVPTGTFPDQSDIAAREEILEVFENYYKYTVKTNDSGDFMIWGVPLGEQLIHVDLDLSDMGCFSLRPDDFILKGYGKDDFDTAYEFKSSEDMDSLPQVITFDRGVEVYPFWGSEDLCQIGITRIDFDLSELGIKIEPASLLIGGSFSDDGKNSVNKNCKPRKNMGKKCNMTTQAGKVEAIRFTSKYDENSNPILEEYTISDEIDDDGAFAIRLPMNMAFLYTNEYGENEYTNDPDKGIATAACYRLRLTLDDGGLQRVRGRASFLLPNIREYQGDEERSYAWSTNFDDYPDDAQDLIFNNVNGDYFPQDYFYRFQYGKVYTVSSFQSLLFDSPKRTLAINDISPAEDDDCASSVNTFPTNMGIKNSSFNFKLLLAKILTFVQYLFSLISLTVYEFVGTFLKDFSQIIGGIGIDIRILTWYPFKKLSERILHAAYNVQEGGQMELPLTIYDTCELCSDDDEQPAAGYNIIDYCKIAEYSIVDGTGFLGNISVTGNSTNALTYFILPDDPNENTAPYTSLYDDGPARNCNNNIDCCDSFLISDDDYTTMNDSEIQNPDGTAGMIPRFVMTIGGHTGTTINEATFDISTGGYAIQQGPLTGGTTHYYIAFTDTEMVDLFGIDSGSTFFEDPTYVISSGLGGYTLDKKYVKNTTTPYTGMTTEDGCEMYDTLYNESILEYPFDGYYLWFSGATLDPPYAPATEPIYQSGLAAVGIAESKDEPAGGLYPYKGATVWRRNSSQSRLPRYYDFDIIPDGWYERKTKTGYSEFRDGKFVIVPSIDGPSRPNRLALREWYRRKIIGINFCGGIVNFAFVDNWLSGSLYFFQFKSKIKDKKNSTKVKACDTVVRYISDHEKFYYRSCVFEGSSSTFRGINNNKDNTKYIGTPTTFVDLGPRDEFINEICTDPSLDPNCSVSRAIGPTSFKSFGELIAFAINYRMDVRGADMQINDFFNNGGFYTSNGRIFSGEISQLISINSEAGIDGFDLQNQKYMGYSVSILDPEDDIYVFQNNTGNWGPTPITLQYEDDGAKIRQCINAPGYLTESSQVVPFYYWDKKDTGFGSHNADLVDNQCWDYTNIVSQKLQGMTHNYKFTDFPPSGDTDVDDPYLLPPISYDFDGYTITGDYSDGQTEEFDNVIYPVSEPDSHYLGLYGTQHHKYTLLLATVLDDPPNDNIMNPIEGRLYIRLGDGGDWSGPITWTATGSTATEASILPSLDPYQYPEAITQGKYLQILSTPFMFYFGLRPGKTGLDILIKRFGPEGAFTPVE